jgi:hypothetical protein
MAEKSYPRTDVNRKSSRMDPDMVRAARESGVPTGDTFEPDFNYRVSDSNLGMSTALAIFVGFLAVSLMVWLF